MSETLNIKAGDIIKFFYSDAKKHKYAVHVEILKVRKDNFTGVLLTSKKTTNLYPGDYLLPSGIMPQPTKIICDQPIKIYKEDIVEVCGNVGPKTLKAIRQKVAESLGIL